MMTIGFICPTCGRKTLIERYEKLVMSRKILHVDFSDNAYQMTSKSNPITYYRVGDSNLENSDKAVHKFHCKKCNFELPIRNAAELIEWLLFHKMVTLNSWSAPSWPVSRAAFIKKGEISRELLEDLYGPAYVPPDDDELNKALLTPSP